MNVPLGRPHFPMPWSGQVLSWTDAGGTVTLHRDGRVIATVELLRCTAGRLSSAYPVAAHDIEVRMTDASPEDLISSLSVVISAARQADPECRKVVFAVERDGPEQARSRAIRTIAAAEAAGLRYVVDVDVPGHELSLLVSEPDWVTEVDMDLDHVPGT